MCKLINTKMFKNKWIAATGRLFSNIHHSTFPLKFPTHVTVVHDRDQCLGKIEVPLSRVKGVAKPVDMIESLSPAEDATEASGDLRVTVQLEWRVHYRGREESH